jgi:hypothetical protein
MINEVYMIEPSIKPTAASGLKTSLIMLGVIYGLVKFGWSVYPSLLEETIIKIELT